MEKSSGVAPVFLTGIILSALCSSSLVLDYTLTPRVVALAAFLLFAGIALFRSGFRPLVKPDLLLWLYFLYAMFCCLSVLWSNTTSEAWFESVKVVLGFFTFILAYYVTKYNGDYFAKGLLKAAIVIVFIGCFVAFIQYSDKAMLTKDSLYAISGLNGHKNLYTSFLFLNSFFLIRGLLTTAGGLRVFSGVALVLTVIMLIFLRTKAVWAGALLSLGVFGMASRFRSQRFSPDIYKVLLAALLLANLFFLYLLPMMVHGMLHFADTGTSSLMTGRTFDSERLGLWEKTFDMIRKHPIAGVGMGNWQIYFPDATLSGIWRAEDLNYTFQRPHNDFLWVLSETGLIGFNLMLLFVFGLLLFLLKSLRTLARSGEPAGEAALCLAFITGFYVISFFDFPKERVEHTVWINIILGNAYCLIRKQTPLPSWGAIRIRSAAYLLAGAVLLGAAYTGMMRYQGELSTRRMYDCRGRGQNEEAIGAGYEAMSFAYSIDPTSVPVHWYTANAYASMGDLKKAQADFRIALRFNPYNRNVLNDLGSSYAALNSDSTALRYYAEAARISPRFDDPKLNAAAVYIREKRMEKADSCLHQLLHDSERRKNLQEMVNAFR